MSSRSFSFSTFFIDIILIVPALIIILFAFAIGVNKKHERIETSSNNGINQGN